MSSPRAFAAKHFHECVGNEHLDARYGCGDLDRATSLDTLRRLWTTFAALASEHGLSPLVMHGSLIGLSFNGRLLPWDDDIDVCFIGDDIHTARRLDGTAVEDARFEVNPNSVNRSPDDRNNVIDARLICTLTGMFIDVTFLTPINSEIVSCKSPHHYALSDLLPVQATRFEGAVSFMPANVTTVLQQEYGAQVVEPRFQNWRFAGGEWRQLDGHVHHE